jgi:hypothetical protein
MQIFKNSGAQEVIVSSVQIELHGSVGSFFTSGKNDLVKFILKIAGHLGVLGTLPQLHH